MAKGFYTPGVTSSETAAQALSGRPGGGHGEQHDGTNISGPLQALMRGAFKPPVGTTGIIADAGEASGRQLESNPQEDPRRRETPRQLLSPLGKIVTAAFNSNMPGNGSSTPNMDPTFMLGSSMANPNKQRDELLGAKQNPSVPRGPNSSQNAAGLVGKPPDALESLYNTFSGGRHTGFPMDEDGQRFANSKTARSIPPMIPGTDGRDLHEGADDLLREMISGNTKDGSELGMTPKKRPTEEPVAASDKSTVYKPTSAISTNRAGQNQVPSVIGPTTSGNGTKLSFLMLPMQKRVR